MTDKSRQVDNSREQKREIAILQSHKIDFIFRSSTTHSHYLSQSTCVLLGHSYDPLTEEEKLRPGYK